MDEISNRIEQLTGDQASEMESLIIAFNTGTRTAQCGTSAVIDHLRECAFRREHIDIYQMVAYRCQNRGHYTFTDYKALCKAVLAMFAQTVGIVVILGEDVLREHASDGPFCKKEATWSMKAMSFLFCMAMCVLCYHRYVRLSHYGMYRVNVIDLSNKPDFVNPYWLLLGRFVNVTVLLMVLWGALSLIYWSADGTELVVHAMAMLFLLDIGSLFVNERDYRELAEFLSSYKHVTDYDIAGGFKVLNQMVYYPLLFTVALSLVTALAMSFVVAYCQ